jgi:putative sterol carrier protein
MEQQRPTKTTAKPRATARRVPGLEGLTGKLRVEVPGKPPLSFAVHDGTIEPVEQTDGPVDAIVAFEDDSCVEELLKGKLNPMVAALQQRLRVSGDVKLVAKVLFELQGQATGFGRPVVGEA